MTEQLDQIPWGELNLTLLWNTFTDLRNQRILTIEDCRQCKLSLENMIYNLKSGDHHSTLETADLTILETRLGEVTATKTELEAEVNDALMAEQLAEIMPSVPADQPSDSTLDENLLDKMLPSPPDFIIGEEPTDTVARTPRITEVTPGVGYRGTDGWYVYQESGCHHHPAELQSSSLAREFHQKCLASGKSSYQPDLRPICF